MRLLAFALSITFFSSVVFAHPGRTDSRGGHHDRKTGGYHYHGSPSVTPSIPVRTQPRLTYNTSPRISTKTTARTDEPRISTATFGDHSPSTLSEKQRAKFDHKLGVSSKSGTRSIFKVRLIGESIFFPSTSELKLIGESFDPGTNYSVQFFLPGMDLDDPYWAYAEKTGRYPLKIKVFDDRAPSQFLIRPSGI